MGLGYPRRHTGFPVWSVKKVLPQTMWVSVTSQQSLRGLPPFATWGGRGDILSTGRSVKGLCVGRNGGLFRCPSDISVPFSIGGLTECQVGRDRQDRDLETTDPWVHLVSLNVGVTMVQIGRDVLLPCVRSV